MITIHQSRIYPPISQSNTAGLRSDFNINRSETYSPKDNFAGAKNTMYS